MNYSLEYFIYSRDAKLMRFFNMQYLQYISNDSCIVGINYCMESFIPIILDVRSINYVLEKEKVK